ncbi:MAG: formylglycine-generating enzyme family protein [Thermodesulfobacteriota bacterium]
MVKIFSIIMVVLLLISAGFSPALSQKKPEDPGISFRLIPGGYYLLGSPVSEPGRYADEDTPHRVRVDAFYIALTETTNAQYGRFLKASGHQPPLYWEDKNLNAPTQPVVGVTWNDAVAFSRWLTQATGVLHRLPTEQEWEAAARGGLTGQPFPWGSQSPDAGGVLRANYRTNDLAQRGFRFTAPVGSFPANGFGLLDMAGNVAEWCLDRHHPLGGGGPFKPKVLRILKGGSWYSWARDLRCAARQSAAPDAADGFIGFRVVRPAHQAP